ncbi:hypothetical protein BDZ89DRAFT_670110 [Hymenopellis radicata]|nr:hypothetical protein BDZ89DRAFT_670110 [Hymenopellis radicata]
MHRNPFIPFEAEDASAESPEDSYSDGDEQDLVLTEGEDDAFESLPQNSNVFAGLEDDDDDPFNRFLARLQHQSPEKDTRDVPLTRIPPSPLDTPLWKLRCHPRQQHHIMQKLLRADNVPSGIEIHSIIARSFAPSWLYFEAAHARSEVCSRFLMSVPGVVVIHGSPVVEMVPYDEWLHVLSYDQHDTSAPTGSGPWICIETPRKYRGDLGFVFEGEHGLQVLLIPRIQDDYKAKRTYVTRCQTPLTRPSLRLFYTAEHSLLGSPVILDGDANRVLYGDDLFEYGLLVMNYDKVVAAPASQISCAVEYLFRISRHPLLEWTSIPHPFEWQFCQGDRVTVRLRGGGRRTGIVEQIDGGRRLVVDLDGGEGQQSVVWRQVTKLFDVGNEVECLSGRNEGKTGLIMEIVGTLISFSEDAKTIQVAHANMLRLIQSQPPTFTGSLTTVNSDRVWPLTTQATSSKPWAKVYHSGDRVTIYCGEFKGSFATVEGEHMDNVLLRLGTYGPATSFQVLWVPKEWVIDATNYVGPFHAERSPSPLPRSDTPPHRPSPLKNTMPQLGIHVPVQIQAIDISVA